MSEVTVRTPAKINLSLDVTGRLPNGYHIVEMIMQSVGLYDDVRVEKREEGLSLSCSSRDIPLDSGNIAWKAAEVFFSAIPEKGGAHIDITKRIPVAAGLAGGSSNAAGVLVALNRLYGQPLSLFKLTALSKSLGADVAFCFRGGTQLARGIGDQLMVLPGFKDVNVVLVKPDFSVSTPWVYKNLKWDSVSDKPHTSALINQLEEFDVHSLAEGMRNVLESVTVKAYPELAEIMGMFRRWGALGSRMSGSGPTVFGIFNDEASAVQAAENFKKRYNKVFHVKTINQGVE